MKPILLFTGGMDSFIAWYYLNRPPSLFVNLGHRYADFEESTVDILSAKMGMALIKMQAPSIGAMEQPDAHIPLRNMLLATLAAMHGDAVYLVCQEGERTIPDRSDAFFAASSRALTVAAGHQITVDPVFWGMTKVEMVEWYLGTKFSKDLLIETFSCFNPMERMEGPPCAACPACFRRAQAFLLNKIEERWYSHLSKWEGLDEYRKRLNEGAYWGKRAMEMERALKILGH